MSYYEMAHSHIQRLLGEALELDEVEQDGDGDYAFRCGTAGYYVTVVMGGRMVKVWSRAVFGLKPTLAVLREVNATNVRAVHCRAFVSGNALEIEAFLPLQPLEASYLAAVCHEIGTTADAVGELMAAVHGGTVLFDEECETADG